MGWQDHRPRDEARALIFDIVAESPRPLTRTEIARAIRRVKSPHLIDMIEELVDEGIFQRWTQLYPNGVEGYVYALADL